MKLADVAAETESAAAAGIAAVDSGVVTDA